MPCSHSGQLNEIVRVITLLKPMRVLDIGVGFGKYGFLCREYLDVADMSDPLKKYGDRRHKIDGIEAFEGYIGPLQKLVYDEIFIGNALDIIPGFKEPYDLVLLIDVFEHFEKEDGMRLLKLLREKAKNILISTPKHVQEQGAGIYQNVYETHRYEWKRADYTLYADHFFLPNNYSLICFIGEDSGKVRKEFSYLGHLQSRWEAWHPVVDFKVWVGKRFPGVYSRYKELTK